MTQVPALKTQRMQVGGMDCTSCAIKIEDSLEKLAGVSEISVVVSTGRLIVTYDPAQVNEADIQQRVIGLGYTIVAEKSPAKLHDRHSGHQEGDEGDHSDHDHNNSHDQDDGHNHGGGEFNLKREGLLVGVVITLFVLGSVFEQQLKATPYSIGLYLVFIPAYLLSGWTVLTSAGKNILRGQVFDENFLMTIATLGAIAIKELPEAVGVMLFFKVGELFQELAISRARRSISALLEIRPDAANLKTANGIEVVSPEQVKVGDTIIIKPGERIPLDGEIIEGNSQVDTSALTGESVPRTVSVGETILAGMINQTGVLTVTVTKLFGESSIARILDLVENASSKKAETEKFITKFARHYTPIVVILSLLVALIPPLVIPGETHAVWVYRALVLLVISCPCGLVISIPLGYFGGIGGAAKRGILVKGSTFLDTLSDVKAIAFDKTGTLTKGVFKVTEIVAYNGFEQSELLRIAAISEVNSNHPIAKSIVLAYNQPIDQSTVSNYTEIAAHGIQATIEGKLVLAGNDRLMHRESIKHDTCDVEGTVVHLAIDRVYAGYIIIADEIKEDAVQAIRVGKKTHAIVLQNIIFALAVKVIFIILGLMGLATMWEAVFADVGVALVAIFNATRVLK